jgi:hypothetical protein
MSEQRRRELGRGLADVLNDPGLWASANGKTGVRQLGLRLAQKPLHTRGTKIKSQPFLLGLTV